MVTQQSHHYILNARLAPVSDCNQSLQDIVSDIEFYLDDCGESWFYVTVGRAHFLRCCRSWMRLSLHLEKFLFDPKIHYSRLARVLEQEKHRFSRYSYYGKRIRALENLISSGPSFKVTQD